MKYLTIDKKLMLPNYVDTENKFFWGPKNKGFITEKQNIHTTSRS